MIEEILHVDDADDVVEVAVAEGKAGEGAFLDDVEQFIDGLVECEVINVGARRHDLADFQLGKFKGAGEKFSFRRSDGSRVDRLS